MKAISSTFHFGISYFGSLYDANRRLAPSEYAPGSREALKPRGGTARQRCVFNKIARIGFTDGFW